MARPSKESLSVVTHLPGTRPEPPERLSADAAEIWRAVVSSKPHDWFTSDTLHLLEAYCHAVVSHRLISIGVADFSPALMANEKGPALYDKLTRMQERQARVMATIATKLRMTQQSRYVPHAAGRASARVNKVVGARPWDA